MDTDYRLLTADNGTEALQLLARQGVDAALLDLKMPGLSGIELLEEIRNKYSITKVIVLTGHGSIKDAVKAMKLGAVDFLEKPFYPDLLHAKVSQLHQLWRLTIENKQLKKEIEFKFGFDQLLGNSRSMLDIKKLILQVARSDSTVLIEGETGTGKELVARAIHHHSGRSNNIFQLVDCAGLSETLIESELFGHVKGAFTGAHLSKTGLIRSSNRGTLFFDEIGELSLLMQAKLLRVIQEREVRPVGDQKTYPVDIRILAATNRNLEQEVAKGNFREDLFYRLNVVRIVVPPLRDRKEDIPLLAKFFLKRLNTNLLPAKKINREALGGLMRYHWPGNVRELENAIIKANTLGDGEIIRSEDIFQDIDSIPVPSDDPPLQPRGMTLAAWEEAAIINALARQNDNRKAAARLLEISEATLYRKIKKYHILKPSPHRPPE